MATRSKTIEFASTVDLTLTASATNVTKAIDIFIPETVVAFRSVALICTLRDAQTTTGNANTVVLGISTDNVSWDDLGLGAPPGHSGEHQGHIYVRDVTSYFTANWSGTSATWYVRHRLSSITTTNHSFRLRITYEYDDTATTQIKTIRIPIESTQQYATTSWQTLGGATAIPAVEGSYLPEASVVIREAFLELWGGGGVSTGTSDFTLSFRVNGGTQRDWWFSEMALTGNAISPWATYRIDDIEDLSSARSLEIYSSVANTGARIGGWLVVTYEFNASTSTTIYNSLMLGAIDTAGQIPGTTAGDADSWGRTVMIEEPGTITMMESAVCLFTSSVAPAARTINVAVGAQGYTAYTMAGSSSFEMGHQSLVHRIDAGGQNGVDFASLGRGSNTYEVRAYCSHVGVFWNLNGVMVLNYTSSKATAGVGVHAQSRHFLINESTATFSQGRVSTGAAATIPEADYWLMGACAVIYWMSPALGNQALVLNVERESGEGEGEGWESIYVSTGPSDAEFHGPVVSYGAARRAWKRHPLDQETDRMDIETSRSWRLDTPTTLYASWGMLVTWHSHTFDAAGTVSGYAGDGSAIPVSLHRASDGEHLTTGTTSAGGGFSLTWYDDTQDLYVVAREDDTHVGRSANDTAV